MEYLARIPSLFNNSLILLMMVSFSPLALDEAIAEGSSNTIVRFEIRRGTNALGRVDVELFDHEKPETVRNFLLYSRSGAYTNSFMHRCVPGFIVQGGGYSVTNPFSASQFSSFLEVTNLGRLTNEFSVGTRLSNTFGTIAMAKLNNDSNSATSQWFFNLGDNSENLDQQNGGFTVFGRVLESTNADEGLNVLQHFNKLSTNAGIVNLNKLLGTSYTAFNSLPVAYTNTVSRVPQARELYYVNISIPGVTNPVGQTAPAVSLLSPSPNSAFTNQAVTVSGTASDDVEVARVIYQLGDGQWEIAGGTTNWGFSFSPPPGFTTINVESVDWDGNHSPRVSTTLYSQSTMALSLTRIGPGTVSGIRNGQTLRAGNFYTGTATPASGYVFEGWTGSITSTVRTLTFQVPPTATNFSLTAKFNVDPMKRLAGSYRGIFQSTQPSPDGAGLMLMALQTDGNFTGTIYYGNKTYYYNGRFSGKGGTSVSGILGGISRSITLQLQKTNAAGLITGTLSGTAYPTTVELGRLAGSLGTNEMQFEGRHTFAIPAITGTNALTPGGNGFGSAILDRTGLLRLSGVLGDGTTFTAAPRLTRLGKWPLYAQLANGKGAVAGWLSVPTNQPNSIEGTLQWSRSTLVSSKTYPAGFSNFVTLKLSRYMPPASGARVVDWVHGAAKLAGADFSTTTNLMKLTSENILETWEPDLANLRLTLDVTSGRVNGSFIHPFFRTTNTLSGIILQNAGNIMGQWKHGVAVGSLTLDATPFLVPVKVGTIDYPSVIQALSEGGLLQFTTNQVITLTNAIISRYNTALEANGNEVTITGAGVSRLFEIQTNVTFSANGIIFADGYHAGANGSDGNPPEAGSDGFGGALLNLGGTLSLTNCLLTNCVVVGGDAGGYTTTNRDSVAAGRAMGAALYNQGGQLTLYNCMLSDNRAESGRGRSLTRPDLVTDLSGAALGGAIFSDDGECWALDSTFLRNRALGREPLAIDSQTYGMAGDAAGGAIAARAGNVYLSGSAFLTNSAFSAQNSNSNAGAGRARGGAVFLGTNTAATIELSTLTGNSASGGQADHAGDPGNVEGGAVFSGGSLNLLGCTLNLNQALGGSSRPPGTAKGGALHALGPLVVNRSTFNENVAHGGTYALLSTNNVTGADAAGGAIYAFSAFVGVTNSTFVSNRASGGDASNPADPSSTNGTAYGGALALGTNSATLVNLTMALNAASAGTGSAIATNPFGGAIAGLGGKIHLRNSIASSNSPVNFSDFVTDAGFNVSSDGSLSVKVSSSLTNVDAFLGPLQAFSNEPPVMAILVQSPARDLVRSNYPSTDQRGTVRPQGTYADSGAFEFIQTLPIFSIQPSGTNIVRAGTNFTFQVSAYGPGPIRYFWTKDDALIPGATNTTLTLVNLQETNTGFYAAIATNSYGSVTSTVAQLIVDLRPLILIQPRDMVIPPGGSTSVVVSASGPGIGYQWFHNDVAIPGAVGSSIPISNAGPGAQGSYQVIVTNFMGAITSRLAQVGFNSSALNILNQPQSTNLAVGSPLTLNVLASGITPISYQWMLNGVPVPGATANVLAFVSTSRTNSGIYQAVVTNAYAAITSSPAIVTIVGPPSLSISRDPTNITVTCYGDPGRVHRILIATNLPAQNWIPIVTNTQPAEGSFLWTQPVPTNGAAFFRAVTP